MPVPKAITAMGKSAHFCGDFPLTFDNPNDPATGGRSRLTRNFHVYLELTMQAKHDALIRGYCQKIKVEGRREDGAQVRHAKGATAETALAGVYGEKAEIAATVVLAQMIEKWQKSVPGREVFTPGVRVDAAMQSETQSDGYGYEISYWYDGDDIYVLFHCYPDE